jgi:hypothetical protein
MIVIDSITYSIPYRTIKRKADILYKFAERSQDGVLHSELIGIYYNFSIEFGMSSNNASDYVDLWLKLTEPVTSHEVTLPNEGSGITFDAYFSNIRDEMIKEASPNRFRELTVDVIAISPARTP